MNASALIIATAAFAGICSPGCGKAPARSDPIQVHIDIDRTLLPADVTEKAVIKIGLDGIRLPRPEARPTVNLAIVIDRSGSMTGQKIAHAREAALEAVRRLAPDDIVSLIAFDTTVDTLVPAQRVGNGSLLRQAICRVEPNGNTALYDGVSRGASEVRRYIEDGHYVNRIVLLSDGLANVGPSSPEELARLGGSLVREGISVTTIGLGLGFNEDLMTRLAQRSDGNTYFVQESAGLPAIFAAELGDVFSVVAQQLTIEIEFPEGVRPLNFVGRDGVIRGRKAEFTINQVYGGQEKFALIEVEVSPNSAGSTREVAVAHVRYMDSILQQMKTVEVRRTVQFSADRAAVINSANQKLQADYAVNVLAEAKDAAVGLVDANQREAAGALLRKRAAEMNQIGLAYRNMAVQGMAAPTAAAADRLSQEGLGNAERKAYRTDAAQIRNQQNSTSGTENR